MSVLLTASAFLFMNRDAQLPVEETPPAASPEDNRNFDGIWAFTSAGCRYIGSIPAKIIGGKIVVRYGSGQVDPDGSLHSIDAGNGITLTAAGQLSGNTGSGTFNRSTAVW
jgi:outer membrane protein assembly factor BamB